MPHEEIFCVKCRAKTRGKGPLKLARSKNDRMMIAQLCAKCGHKKSSFVSQKRAQELKGEGLLSSLTGVKIPILSDLPLIGDLLF